MSGTYSAESALRRGKYLLLAEGCGSIAVSYLAEAVGVPVGTAVAELGQMAADGAFGVGAYIDYNSMILVLKPGAGTGSGPKPGAAGPADDMRSAWREVKTTAGQQARVWAQEAARTAEGAARQAAQAVNQAAQNVNQAAQNVRAASPYAYGKPAGQPARPAQPRTAGAAAQPGAGKPAQASSPVKPARPQRKGYVSLLLPGIGAAAAGVLCLATSLDHIAMAGFLGWILSGGVLSAAGGALLTVRTRLRRRDVRRTKYQAYLTGRDWARIPQLAAAAGVKPAQARREIEQMAADGLLGAAAYVDSGADALILKPGVTPATADADPEACQDKYFQVIQELRRLDEEISDAHVSELTRSIEETAAKIFRIAEEHPEKNGQLKTFMGYYLPTALKLLRSYATLEKQGIGGSNIDAAKQSIIRSLSTLEDAFRVQLDKLFSADAMDAETDENVLGSMLRRDGLSGREMSGTPAAPESADKMNGTQPPR